MKDIPMALSRKVKARIAKNKLRRAYRSPVKVQVGESDLRYYQRAGMEGGLRRGEIFLLSARGPARSRLQISPHTFEMGDAEVSIVNPDTSNHPFR